MLDKGAALLHHIFLSTNGDFFASNNWCELCVNKMHRK